MEGKECRTILIVDDDLLIQTILSDVLSRHGYFVMTATDGIEACRKATARRPDVIIADKVMPNCDGLELNDFLKSMSDYRSIPIILVSGQFPGGEDEAISMGFFRYVPKPINEATLVTVVENALGVYSP